MSERQRVSNGRGRLVRAVAAVALGAAAVSPAVVGGGTASAAPERDVAFKFTDDRIASSSGLTVSAAEPDYVFTVNDDGPTRVFGVTPDNGRSAATMRLDNTENVDWEAVAAGKGRSLWVGDIGDNEASRPSVTVYRFKLPEPIQTGHYTAKDEYRLNYPDGAHDAETLLVNPTTNALYVVTKDPKGGTLYKAPTPLGDGRNELTKVGKMPPLITDGAFSPDGKQFVLRSYTNAYVYSTAGKQMGSFALPKQEQGEGVAYTSDGESLLLSSEGTNSEVLRLNLDEALATASKPPSASKTPAAGKTDDAGGGADDEGIDLVNALFIAVPFVIALLAAAAAFLLHRRRAAPAGAHGGGAGGRGGGGGGGGRHGERKYERDEPYPPPTYGAVPDVGDEDDAGGWPVPSPAPANRRRSDFEDTQVGPPPSFVEEGTPPPAFLDRGGPPSFQENGVAPSFQDHGAPPVFQPEAAPPPPPATVYEPEQGPPPYQQNGARSYQQEGPAAPPPVPPPPPGGGRGGGRRSSPPSGRRGGKRRRGQRGDDSDPFWLRE